MDFEWPPIMDMEIISSVSKKIKLTPCLEGAFTAKLLLCYLLLPTEQQVSQPQLFNPLRPTLR